MQKYLFLNSVCFYNLQDASTTTHDVEIDLDEVLDMDGDGERRKFLKSLLSDAKKSQDVVNVRINRVTYRVDWSYVTNI